MRLTVSAVLVGFLILTVAIVPSAHAWATCCTSSSNIGDGCPGNGVCTTDYTGVCGSVLYCDVGSSGGSCTDCSAYPGTACGTDSTGSAVCQCPAGQQWSGSQCVAYTPSCPPDPDGKGAYTYNASSGWCERTITTIVGTSPFTDLQACQNATPVPGTTTFMCLDAWAAYRAADEPYYFDAQDHFVNLSAALTVGERTAMQNTITQVCEGGVLKAAALKYSQDLKKRLPCQTNQCYYAGTSSDECIAPNQWRGDDICIGTPPVWSTRTQLLAEAFYNYSVNNNNDFILHCDTNIDALNRYLPSQPYVGPQRITSSIVGPPVINSFCVLSDQRSDGKYNTLAVGTTLNGADMTQATPANTYAGAFIASLNGTTIETWSNSCDDAAIVTSGAFTRCNKNGESRGALWYNGQSAILLISEQNNFDMSGTQNPLSRFVGFLRSLWQSQSPTPLISLSGREVYVAYRNPLLGSTRSVQGKIEPTATGEQATIAYLGIDPSATCASFGISGTDCQQVGGLWVVTLHATAPQMISKQQWDAFTLAMRPQ